MVAYQTAQAPHLNCEEISRARYLPVRPQELGPCPLPFPLRRWFQPCLFQDFSNRSSPNFMSQVRQCSPDPRVAPTPILFRHLDHEITQLILGWRATHLASLPARIIFLRDQLPMPRQQGLRSHEAHDLLQSAEANPLRLARQASSLLVGESQAFLSIQLLQDPDLFPQVIDHVLLLLVDPPGQGHHHQLHHIH